MTKDPRWKYGIPPASNANYAWLSHMIYHLSPRGIMACVLSNGSLSSQTNNEGEIRKQLIENDLVDCIVGLPKQLFYNTGIPACLWFISRKRVGNSERKRIGEILFIDASEIGFMRDRTHRDFSEEDILKIAGTYHNWRSKDKKYEDIKGFCKSATLAKIQKRYFVLTPGRYVGIKEQDDDGVPFEIDINIISQFLREQTEAERKLNKEITKNLTFFYGKYDWKEIDFSSYSILERIAQRIFHEWFVEFNFPNDKNKPYKKTGGKMIDSELGEIPEGWRICKLKDFGEIVCGKTPPKEIKEYFGGNIPFIKIPDMHNQIFIVKTEDSLTEEGADFQKNKFIPKNSLCVSCIATVGLVSITSQDSQTNQQINTIIPNEEAYLEYLYFILKNMKADLEAIGSGGSATLNINTGVFSDIEILRPTDKALKSVHLIWGSLFEKVLSNFLQAKILSRLRNTLLPKLMKGEIRVKF